MAIVVIGSTFVDIKGYPSSVYIPGGRNAGTVETVHGGVARNIAEDVANIGFPCSFVTLLDDTGTGRDVERRLHEHGVDTAWSRFCNDGMGTWLAVFDDGGDVQASISKRPDLLPIADILREHGDEIFSASDGILVELDLDQEIIARSFELAEKYQKPIFAVVSNITIAQERRQYLLKTACFVCNQGEASILFVEDLDHMTPEQLLPVLRAKVAEAKIPGMVVTMGAEGAVYAAINGESGFCPSKKVTVADTTGAGDAFFAGVSVGLTGGKTLGEACAIGTRMAAATIATTENTCPRFQPEEFGLTSAN